MNSTYDVLIVGAGNAAMCGAISARERGASTLVLEKAPEYFRGGNTYFTGGIIRCAYDGIEDIKLLIPDLTPEEEASIDVGKYTQDDFYSDVMRVTEGLADPEMAQLLVSESHPTLLWLRQRGVRFVLAFGRQAFKVGDKYRFWGGLLVESVGAGKGLSDANSEMRTRYLGPGWELAKVRGVPYNTGDGIRMALDIGAQSFGHWSSCHAVAWDINAPPFGDRTITELYQKHSYPFGLIVNLDGKRFVDEGADFRNYTYAAYGREILKQPLGAAFQIFDEKVKHLLRDEYRIAQVTMATTNTMEELADRLGINREGLLKTVREFNAAVQPGNFNPTVLDGKRTQGITPPKSNWALPIDTPPFLGYAVTCGITFTFGGLKIDTRGQVLDTEGNAIPGLYAAGELVGGLFYHNYAGGSGRAAGAVFGKLAGSSAAEDALKAK
ncbi:MAG: FAD-binding protein [Nitrospinae bacterium]|nr:FAD-binding protein [Nitrospinota bacterium]